jgi:hypothetical protein
VFISVLSVKRQTQQKKRKERERKELDALGRKQFANVRVVQRNVVYVVGLGSRFAKEEVLHITSTDSVAHDICSSSQLSDRTSILGNTARSPRSSLSSATSLGQSLRSLVSTSHIIDVKTLRVLFTRSMVRRPPVEVVMSCVLVTAQQSIV